MVLSSWTFIKYAEIQKAQGLPRQLVQLALAMVPAGDAATTNSLGCPVHRLIALKASEDPEAGKAHGFRCDKAIRCFEAQVENMSTGMI